MPSILQPNLKQQVQIRRQLLEQTSTLTTVLIVILLDRFGSEFMEWHPETIRLEVRDEFQIALPDANMDKIMAGIAILTTDLFFTKPKHFNDLCNVLAGDTFDPATFDIAEPDEIAWAITEVMILDPPEEDEPFSDEVRAYIGQVLDYFGIVNPPGVLQIAIAGADRVDPLSVVADDPEMYSAFYARQQDQVDEIETIVKANSAALFQQLGMLQLENGSTRSVLERVSKVIQ